MTETSRHRDGVGRRWWETPGSLRSLLLRLDGQVGTVVNAEKHLVDPAVVSGGMVGQLGRLVQEMGLDRQDGVVGQLDTPVFEPVKPGFTREAGSIRHQIPRDGTGDPGR